MGCSVTGITPREVLWVRPMRCKHDADVASRPAAALRLDDGKKHDLSGGAEIGPVEEVAPAIAATASGTRFPSVVVRAEESSKGITFTDVDAAHAKTLENRANWYEARWCAVDQPEWNPATFVRSDRVAPDTKLAVLEVEISRERVALLNAYKRVGQLASIRVNNGIEYKLKPANAPFPEALNKYPLYVVRGDQSAYDIKTEVEATSVKANLELLVTEESCPDLFAVQDPDIPVDVGPFSGPGLDLRGSALAIYKCPTVVVFAEGEGIATARALIEATEDIPGISLPFRETVRLYYKAPNEDSFIFTERFAQWEKMGCTVMTTTNSFQDAFDEDDTLLYEPTQTLALILTGGDAETEKAATDVCKEAEIFYIIRESEEAIETEYVRTGSSQV